MAYARLRAWRGTEAGLVDELALEAADTALVAVLGHLDDFRGESRFTTWACRFAVTEVSAAMRRRWRHRRELPVEPQTIVRLTGSSAGADRDLEQRELVRWACATINEALSEHQRTVPVALAVDGGSPAALAAALGTSEGAVYKSLHDARLRLRRRFAARDLPGADGGSAAGSAAGGKNTAPTDSNMTSR
jgi:RNA polymerase sigma-70 factor (ECF subfamily)